MKILACGKGLGVQFCNTILGIAKEGIRVLGSVLISDEAHIRVLGFLNKQNMQYGAPVNPT